MVNRCNKNSKNIDKLLKNKKYNLLEVTDYSFSKKL